MNRDEIEWRSGWLDDWPGRFWLVEPTIGSTFGIPDTHVVATNFAPGWVEFKAIDDNGQFKVRPAQRLFFKTFCQYSTRAAVIVLDGQGFWAIPGRTMALQPVGPLVPELIEGARYYGGMEGKTRHALEIAFG